MKKNEPRSGTARRRALALTKVRSKIKKEK